MRQYSNKCQPAGASRSWDTVQLQHSFGTPVVVAQVQTANNEEGTVPSGASQPWLTTAVDSVTSSSFNVALESAETQAFHWDKLQLPKREKEQVENRRFLWTMTL